MRLICAHGHPRPQLVSWCHSGASGIWSLVDYGTSTPKYPSYCKVVTLLIKVRITKNNILVCEIRSSLLHVFLTEIQYSTRLILLSTSRVSPTSKAVRLIQRTTLFTKAVQSTPYRTEIVLIN